MSRQQQIDDSGSKFSHGTDRSHSVTSQSQEVDTELTTSHEGEYIEIHGSVITATSNTTFGSDASHNGQSSGDTVTLPYVEKSLLR